MLRRLVNKVKVLYYRTRYDLPEQLWVDGWCVCKTIPDRELIDNRLYSMVRYYRLGSITLKLSVVPVVVSLRTIGINGVNTHLIYTLKGNPFNVRLEHHAGHMYYVSDLKGMVK